MYRVGKKQKRAVLDKDGRTVVVFEKGEEELALRFVDFLNQSFVK